VLAAAALALAGCGLGPGPGTSNVSVTVTREFGTTPLAAISRSHVPGSETVMRLLERSFRVQTRFGGGFVESIDGFSGDSSRHDWFYYVNGIEAPVGAAGTAVHRGDRIWWDLHDWSATQSVPAVIGSFPEPFLHGIGGRRLPTTVQCAPDVGAACTRVTAALTGSGVPVAPQLLGTGSGTDSLGVVVGTWSELRSLIVGGLIAHGPGSSGVYARFAVGGLQLLDPHGNVVRTLGPGAGLIAATRNSASPPVWLVTGTDVTGVAAAAGALTKSRLRDHFALAVSTGGPDLPLPIDPSR
jgi:hypothetical protein